MKQVQSLRELHRVLEYRGGAVFKTEYSHYEWFAIDGGPKSGQLVRRNGEEFVVCAISTGRRIDFTLRAVEVD